jgi:hypothetical protein
MSKTPIDKLYYVFGFGNHLTFSAYPPFVKSINPKRFTSREFFSDRFDSHMISQQRIISLQTNFDFDNITIVRTNDFVNTFVQIPKRIFTRDMPYRNNEEMYATLNNILLDLVNPNVANVFVVGHSAGGAFVNHLAKKINAIFAGRNIKIRKRVSIKTTRFPKIRKTVRARLGDFTYRDSKTDRSIQLQPDHLKKLHIASFGAIWLWDKRNAIPSVKIHNYLSRTDISNFCVGKKVCNELMSKRELKSIDKNNNDTQFDCEFSIMGRPRILRDIKKGELVNSGFIYNKQILCSCLYDEPKSSVIPICLYNDENEPICNYESFLDGYGEHQYYNTLINTLLLNRELNIYDYKDGQNNSGAILTRRNPPDAHIVKESSPLRSKSKGSNVKTDYS